MSKAMILVALVSMASFAQAKVSTFNCGKWRNVTQLLVVTELEKENAHGYNLAAKLTLGGSDSTTGIVTGKATDYEGQVDASTDFGKAERVLSFVEVGAPQRQFLIQDVKLNKTAKAELIILGRETKNFDCKLVSQK